MIFSATFVLVHLASFAASRIPRWDTGTLISYCGYAISAACLGVAVVLLVRSFSVPAVRVNVRPTRGLPPANCDRARDDKRIGGLAGQLAAQ